MHPTASNLNVVHAPGVLKRMLRRLSPIRRSHIHRLLLTKKRSAFSARNYLTYHRPISVNVADVQISLLPRGAIAAGIWNRTYFQHQEISLFLRLLSPGMTFLDIGANVGLFSLFA